MAIPIINNWQHYFFHQDEGLGSSYERIILNRKLQQIVRLFAVENVLEAPCFGFTGISGINSMGLAKQGKSVTLIEHNPQRSEFIKKIWNEVNLPVTIKQAKTYEKLPFPANDFDLSWNFSALWFVHDLAKFLEELTRVTKKAILICVPNQLGIGYLSQQINSDDEQQQIVKENINPKRIKTVMNTLNWKLLQSDFIDSPPWPDIGMPKEAFLKKFGMDTFIKTKESAPTSIIPYYKDIDLQFAEKMLSYYPFEKHLPTFCKRFWAHHQYFLFISKK